MDRFAHTHPWIYQAMRFGFYFAGFHIVAILFMGHCMCVLSWNANKPMPPLFGVIEVASYCDSLHWLRYKISPKVNVRGEFIEVVEF